MTPDVCPQLLHTLCACDTPLRECREILRLTGSHVASLTHIARMSYVRNHMARPPVLKRVIKKNVITVRFTDPLLVFAVERANTEYEGSLSSYVRALVERDRCGRLPVDQNATNKVA